MPEKTKTGSDLRDNPLNVSKVDKQPNANPTPFDKAYDILSNTDGNLLEITTRTTPRMADAGQVALAYSMRFGTRYIASLYEQIERQAIALGGQGRGEFVEITKYGAGVPPSFYENKGEDKRSFIPMGKDEDNGNS